MDDAPHQPRFASYVISPALEAEMEQDPERAIPVIISFQESRTEPQRGIAPSKEEVKKLLGDRPYRESDFYLFARLTAAEIAALARRTDLVYQIWRDEKTYGHLLTSTETIKAAACWRAFEARGKGITWAVLDTGIRCDHPHFQRYQNVDRSLSRNFSNMPDDDDQAGHGTHVAGIIAGSAPPPAAGKSYRAARSQQGQTQVYDLPEAPSGVAPMARLVNIKVLDNDATGDSSNAILGLEYVRKLNQSGRDIKVDGVNMSLGYPFDPKVYGCGHSPLCQEVTRAVNSGLVVVISSGNWGYGMARLDTGRQVPVSIGQSVTDPANTEDAIAVGSSHKSAPHTYGISYFSSKGPTGDGRMKPDLVAPGEKVVSCSLHYQDDYDYEEQSGTSMAAPHVSGAIAAFLSVHTEFRGQPRKVKEIFLKTATDLGRARDFQGAGLVDLMRAMMSV